jgi:hypothetical protein
MGFVCGLLGWVSELRKGKGREGWKELGRRGTTRTDFEDFGVDAVVA